MTEKDGKIAILGVFVADTAYRAPRQPKMGETILGMSFALGPRRQGVEPSGGGGTAWRGCTLHLEAGPRRLRGSRTDDMERRGRHADRRANRRDLYRRGVHLHRRRHRRQRHHHQSRRRLDDRTRRPRRRRRVDPGRRRLRHPARATDPCGAAWFGNRPAPPASPTILNPAPAAELDDDILALCDWVTPNESEAEGLTGMRVTSPDEARAAADAMIARGAKGAVITLGEAGALLHTSSQSDLIPAFRVGDVVETTGAGDAFNGGFAVGLARGMPPAEAVRLGCAVAGVSVTRRRYGAGDADARGGRWPC